MTRARSVLFAALIVCSAIIGAAGPALAQSTETATDSGPVTKTFETGPHKVKIDLFDVSSETTITVITDESPVGDNTAILRKTVSGSHNSAHFRNAGAYEQFTIRVEGADGPVSMSKGGVTDAWKPGDDGKFLGDTGGDPGFNYELSEQIGETMMPSIVQLDRTGLPGETTVNTTNTDAEQIELDVYQSALTLETGHSLYHDSIDNNLNDAQTVALIKGKNAYIQSLNNGSTKAVAKTEAHRAINEYYARMQVNLIARWDTSVSTIHHLNSTVVNESGVSGDVVSIPLEDVNDGDVSDMIGIKMSGVGTTSVPLVNGTSATAMTLKAQGGDSAGGYGYVSTIGPTDGVTEVARFESNINGNDPAFDATATRITVDSPPSGDGRIDAMRFNQTSAAFNEIETQHSAALAQIDTVINGTYDSYQRGEINNSDLVDPYVLANQQSAGDDFQGWAASQLTLMGTNSPENFDQIGSFEISNDGSEYEGVLFSQTNPASGQFESGNSYNASTLRGTQYVVTSDRIVELHGGFSIGNITDSSGEQVQNVTIEKTTYKTTNVTELKQQYEDLAYKRAQIEAREKALKQSAGGGLLGGGSVPPVVALAVIGTLLAIVVLQN
ncbi:hypothetical protein [Haloarcula sebkhae]|uniref:Envelope protein N-terminal domain-containing protein n=2 Tax=Haloarcula sebkhae TaxID=932660 RepID=A0A830ENF5_9EURY|nr:hypothetical protein [Haloarcula sebkhae]GGK56668.1 hypothetical protein GCM10009067_06420 [Haloarcula sebkhae]